MDNHLAGIFQTQVQAEQAITALEARGLERDEISLVVAESAGAHLFSKTDDEAGRAAKGAAAGALTGGILGVLVAGLSLVGAGIPGVALLAAGPLYAILGSAIGGAAMTGVGGALVAAGFAADDANRYEAELKAGRAVLIIHTSDEAKIAAARAVLQDTGTISAAA